MTQGYSILFEVMPWGQKSEATVLLLFLLQIGTILAQMASISVLIKPNFTGDLAVFITNFVSKFKQEFHR